MPKCVVVDTAFTWAEDPKPRHPWHETIVYELHLGGFTMRHPEVPEPMRGTAAGLARREVVAYLRSLGITTVELLPVHAFLDDRHLVERGLRNYWGYNTLGFFAPDNRYLASGELGEFKTLVQHLHDAGIEVVLDVVYNHTAEGNQMGPTLSFRGIDNASYYALVPGDERYYQDFTGCGNALNLRHPRVLQLVMDSLRYWVEEMHVDGFRFDLASTLARVDGRFSADAGFLDAVNQDPVLSEVKLIAEPWDVGQDGYQLGGFPPGWAEWNDRYRDVVRRFWKGEPGVGELASRITGSSDLFDCKGRRPHASVNFVTAHDGFTLHDLVSYDRKHNEANGEHNRDGTDANHGWNCGVEGPTDDPEIRALRFRQKRNLIATLLLSQGVPMLLAGDERSRTQHGNNNAYCHDDEIGWMDWAPLGEEEQAFFEFVRECIALRRDHIAFHRHRFFQGGTGRPGAAKDIAWLRADGQEMEEADWHAPESRQLACVISGEAHGYHLTATGEPERDDDFLWVLNGSPEPFAQALPPPEFGLRWEPLLDTAQAAPPAQGWQAGKTYTLGPRSLVLFVRRDGAATTRGRR
jgi:glycogen operon protein